MSLPEADVVIVGMGWVGGIMAAELTKAGLNVVGLERGQERGTDDFQHDHDELRFAIRNQLMQDTGVETWTLRHNLTESALPIRYLGAFLPGTGVGGAGVHWNGATWRFLPRDFEIRTQTLARYGAGAIPADMSIQDWGITFDQLEPYYDKFEYMAGISGKAGNIKGTKIQGGNVFEGPRSREYPVPPMKVAHAPAVFKEAAAKLGYHPFPQPSANLPQVYKNPDGITRAGCTYCGFCERFGCEVGAKADPLVTVLPVAMKTGKLEMRTGTNVFRINHDGKRAASVSYYDANGNVQEQPAGIVILGAYVFNNVRLLLLSGMGKPYDPNTGGGVVGKNYAYQVGGGASGFFKNLTFNRWMGSGANGFSIDDFNGDNFDHSGLGFIGGGNIAVSATGARPIQSLSVPKDTPTWGPKWKTAIREWYNRVASVGIQGEVVSYKWRHLDLDPTYKDAWGNPLLRITFDWADNERKMIAYISQKCAQIAKEMGADIVQPNATLAPHYDVAPYQSTHNTGGAIMGGDPGTSVVNNYLQMWDYDNVFVIGASAFPQNAGRNPTGTVGALAYRAADGIINKYRKNPGPLV